MGHAIRKLSEQILPKKMLRCRASSARLSCAWLRKPSAAKNYGAINEVCAGMELISVERPVLMTDMRARVGVENRLPEFIEEAIRMEPSLLRFCRSCAAPASPAPST